MTRLLTTLVALTALISSLASATTPAEDKKGDHPIKGVWVKDADGVELSFNFKTKDELILKAKAGGNGMTATCKYTVEKGVVSAEVTEVVPIKPTQYLSDFVRKKRKQVRLTQQELADKAGVGLRFVRELEAGKLTLRIDKVHAVLLLFGAVLIPHQTTPL